MEPYVKRWWCPVRPCDHRYSSGAIAPYSAPNGDSEESYYALHRHLMSVHGFAERDANIALSEVEHQHDVDIIVLAAGKRFRDCTLDTFPAADAAGKRALEQLRDWLEGGNSLYLHGPVGSGKTGAAVSLARELTREIFVKFLNTRAFLAELRASYSSGRPVDDPLASPKPELLILDDAGAERPTDWARDALATIIEAHHADNGSFITTSNYAPSSLIARLGHDDPTVGRRMVSRLTDGATVIKLDRADLRVRREAA